MKERITKIHEVLFGIFKAELILTAVVSVLCVFIETGSILRAKKAQNIPTIEEYKEKYQINNCTSKETRRMPHMFKTCREWENKIYELGHPPVFPCLVEHIKILLKKLVGELQFTVILKIIFTFIAFSFVMKFV